jgi:dTMP kinase
MFVALEGIDGAGKTSLSRAITDALSARGVPACAVHKRSPMPWSLPSLPAPATQLGDLIWNPASADSFELMGPDYWTHLMAAWFHSLYRLSIDPLLGAGMIVVVDSWTAKFAAKLAAHDESNLQTVLKVFASLPIPDFVLLVDVSPATALSRRGIVNKAEGGNARGGTTPAAFFDYQSRVATHLTALADENSWTRLSNEQASLDGAVAIAVDEILARSPKPNER